MEEGMKVRIWKKKKSMNVQTVFVWQITRFCRLKLIFAQIVFVYINCLLSCLDPPYDI